MSIEVTCDGCGKRETVKRFEKPWEWFQREIDGVVELACNRRCIKSGLVLPLAHYEVGRTE